LWMKGYGTWFFRRPFFSPPPLLGVFRRSSGLQHRRIPFRRRQKMDT
jgi:hypothetical protein